MVASRAVAQSGYRQQKGCPSPSPVSRNLHWAQSQIIAEEYELYLGVGNSCRIPVAVSAFQLSEEGWLCSLRRTGVRARICLLLGFLIPIGSSCDC